MEDMIVFAIRGALTWLYRRSEALLSPQLPTTGCQLSHLPLPCTAPHLEVSAQGMAVKTMPAISLNYALTGETLDLNFTTLKPQNYKTERRENT